MFKKSISVLLAILLLCGVFNIVPISAYAQEADIAEVGANVDLSKVGGDDYPYSGGIIDAVDQWKFYTRECTSFCAWRLNNNNGVAFTNWYGGVRWGNAGNWGYAAQSIGITVDNNPVYGSIAWWSGGHVAWVSGVDGDTVYIEEYNYNYSHNYGTRAINRYNPSGYIHIKDINPPIPQGHIMSEAEGAGRTIPDGNYWIGSKIAENYFIGIPDNDFNTWNEKNVQTWKWDSGLPPKYDVFHITYLNNGFYKITQMNTRMVIDVYGGKLERGSNISMWEDTGSTAQQWSIEKTDGGYKIRSRGNNFYLDIYDGKYENGTNVLTWENHKGNNQYFTFIPYAPDERPVSDGKYKISSAVSNTCYLDVYGGINDFKNLSNIGVYNSPDDTFQIEYLGNGYYRVCEETSQLAVEVINDGEQSYLNNSRNVILYGKNNRKNQAWYIRKNNDGTFCFVNQLSGYYLDLEHENTDDGTNVSQYQYNGNRNQKWKLHRVIEESMITVGDIKSSIDPPVITINVDGNLLEADKDYTTSLKYNAITRIYSVTINGINDYCGSVIKEFTINKDEPSKPTTIPPTTPPTELSIVILGDVDGDGEVSVIDATNIQRYKAQLQISIDIETLLNCGDIDGDGEVTILDSTLIQRYTSQMPLSYPVGEPI